MSCRLPTRIPQSARRVPPNPFRSVFGTWTTRSSADHAAKIRVPDFHYFYQAVEDGALASYGHSSYALFHRAASYVDRVLKGAHPRDLPVEQVERYSFVLNLKTARTLGITIPQSVLVRAEQVIE